MEPRIQFARCSDGVSIAYYEIGDGVPLIHTPGSVTNLQTEWQNPGRRRWYERLAASFRVIRYDRRGTGLSDRDVVDYSVEALERDIEAVANQARLQQCAVWGSGYSGPAAMAFTAHHPQRVSRLILYGTDAKGGGAVEARDSTNEYLLEQDWALFSEIWTRQTYEWRDAEQVRAEAARMRESISPEVMRLFLDARRTTDVFETLPQIRCPTLVVYRPQWANRRDVSAPNVDLVRATAQAIPSARMVALEGTDPSPYAADADALLKILEEFVLDRESATRPSTSASTDVVAGIRSGTAIILFADVVDSTGLTERMGDEAFRAKSRDLDGKLRAVIKASGGTAIEGKVLGDGVMAVFGSARQAVECALRCNAVTEGSGLQLHLGVHAGDVINEGSNVFGGAVNVAARIAGESAPGEVLVSDVVRALARTSTAASFEDRGEVALKGVAEAQRIFAVRPR